jgi:DNA-3-methyladenine glycosylase
MELSSKSICGVYLTGENMEDPIEKSEPKRLDQHFFERPVEIVAPDLIGCYLFTNIKGHRVGGMVIETEAYNADDPAAHCHPEASKRRRDGSDAMFLSGGHAYIHYDRGMPCLNLTCDKEGFCSAVLVRSIMPIEGFDVMTSRRSAHPKADQKVKSKQGDYRKRLCNGPGKVGEAFGLGAEQNKMSLFGADFEIRGKDKVVTLLNGPRINISKGIEAAWRWGHGEFRDFLSKPFKTQTEIG